MKMSVVLVGNRVPKFKNKKLQREALKREAIASLIRALCGIPNVLISVDGKRIKRGAK